MGFRKKRKAIVSSITRAALPGVKEDGESELVQARTVPHVVAEKSRAAQMLGARGLEQKHADQVYREIGVPIFDMNAGQSQLHDLLQRGKPDG